MRRRNTGTLCCARCATIQPRTRLFFSATEHAHLCRSRAACNGRSALTMSGLAGLRVAS